MRHKAVELGNTDIKLESRPALAARIAPHYALVSVPKLLMNAMPSFR